MSESNGDAQNQTSRLKKRKNLVFSDSEEEEEDVIPLRPSKVHRDQYPPAGQERTGADDGADSEEECKIITVPPAEMQSLKDIPRSKRKEYIMKSLNSFINKVMDDQEEEINLLKNSTAEATAGVELWKNKAVTYQVEIEVVKKELRDNYQEKTELQANVTKLRSEMEEERRKRKELEAQLEQLSKDHCFFKG
ncbi:OLC1v1012150C1 [Oldenlandia corymbosa var. corymbosa]|uniref:OLC1v1012150C1 n=1 Tax=Oldenlandia corymbosa var. corymbosa TaxID=529605 RepID=A0AAV1DX38_OLDCO|nr:OLC1v1012150C1 [Oldenlandia corymbosa var. corymbosa]